jgi:hypothetical protein
VLNHHGRRRRHELIRGRVASSAEAALASTDEAAVASSAEAVVASSAGAAAATNSACSAADAAVAIQFQAELGESYNEDQLCVAMVFSL